MKRRQWVFAGAGAVAAAAGVWWQGRRAAVPASAAAPAPAASGADATAGAATDTLWQAKFTQPDGQLLTMAALRGKPLVLNFWATWCPPCLKEMPEIDRFARLFAQQGGQVIGLAIDNPSAVNSYLQRTPVSYSIALAGFDGTDLSRALGNSSGALPFTVALNRAGAVAQRRLGETSFDELMAWARTLG